VILIKSLKPQNGLFWGSFAIYSYAVFGWILASLSDLPPFFAVGLILVASCPGGTASTVIVYLAKVNVALSVTMTTISTLAAIIMIPLLTSYFSGSYLEVDAIGLFYSTLKIVLFPVTLGVILNKCLPT
tara:strand:- start:595 stop:981 length:387 start_codon:yes stop_codon:yes gene_type:complete